MAIRSQRHVCLPWPTYRVGWRRPARRGSDDFQRVMVVDAKPRWFDPRPDDGARASDLTAALIIIACSAFIMLFAFYGAISLIRDLVGWW